MDELRTMLEQAYLQISLMHKFFSSRVRELEEAYVILKQKTTKIVNDKNDVIKNKNNAIESIRRDLHLEREILLGFHSEKLGAPKTDVEYIASMLSKILYRMQELASNDVKREEA